MGRKLFTALVAVLFLYISLPLLLPVIMGGIFAVLFMPALEKMERRKVPAFFGSAAMTLSIALLIILPLGAITVFGAKSIFQQLQVIKQMPQDGAAGASGDWIDSLITSAKVSSALEWVTRWFPVDINALRESVHDLVHATALKLADLLGQFITALPGIILSVAVMVVSIFFFLMDGRSLVRFLRRNSVFNVPQTDLLFKNLDGMCRSVILASVASGIAQSLIMAIGTLAMGIPNFGLITSMVFLGSFIPVIGSIPVTVGVCLQQLAYGNNQTAFVMAIVALMVGVVDNFVRPYFLRGSANLHPLLAFVAAFGGLQTFGFIGVFLGPLVASLFVATLKIVMVPDSHEVQTG